MSQTLIEFDSELEQFTAARGNRRQPVTSSRGALNGYQKGRCFYCFDAIAVAGDGVADVDHFFPWSARRVLAGNVDGIWNLVLACRRCNRSSLGKAALIPVQPLLERLFRRNEFLITSHHPLRETLMAQTGHTHGERAAFLRSAYDAAVGHRILTWSVEPVAASAF